MTLSSEQKQRLEDFFLNKNDENPQEYIPIEDEPEAKKYIQFIMSRGILRIMYKICAKMEQ